LKPDKSLNLSENTKTPEHVRKNSRPNNSEFKLL
jgi:hypothetical protein